VLGTLLVEVMKKKGPRCVPCGSDEELLGAEASNLEQRQQPVYTHKANNEASIQINGGATPGYGVYKSGVERHTRGYRGRSSGQKENGC
jgi:hypothetical protein